MVAALRGREDDARRLADEVAGLAQALERYGALSEVRPGFGHPLAAILTVPDRMETLVRLGRTDDAIAALPAFEAWATHAGAARARSRLLSGQHLRRERRRVDAREQLRAAIETFERFDAGVWAERARADLRASGGTARKRDPSTLLQLTAQELQVARLVAEGMSNKEVAARLFLSPRTIDAHLRSVFSKLGITSRTQLARLPLGEAPAAAPQAGAAVPA
jgi:DNA-binding CsgD family transcriptional regulator